MKERQKGERKKALEKKRKQALAQRLAEAVTRSGDHLRDEKEMDETEVWKELATDVSQPRSFLKEVKELIQRSDVILEVLDARDPQGCRCPDIEKFILSQMTPAGAPSKRLILVINKIDLIPGDALRKWMKYLRREFPTVAFKSAIQQKGKIGEFKLKPTVASHTKQDDIGSFSGSIGGKTLLQLLKNYSRSGKIKTAITVGVIGFPNVGKSSIINSLKRERAVNVGSTPGVTKTLQHVKLDQKINLIDSPGVLFSIGKDDEDLVLRNCLKAEQLTDPVGVVNRIVQKCSEESLCQLYRIEKYEGDAEKFLQVVAIKRGKLKKGGIPNTRLAAMSIILDWNAGKIPFYSLPPETQDISQTIIVNQDQLNWSEEFGLKDDEVDQEVEETLSSSSATSSPLNFTILPSSGPAPMGIDRVEEILRKKQKEKKETKFLFNSKKARKQQKEEEEDDDDDDDDDEEEETVTNRLHAE